MLVAAGVGTAARPVVLCHRSQSNQLPYSAVATAAPKSNHIHAGAWRRPGITAAVGAWGAPATLVTVGSQRTFTSPKRRTSPSPNLANPLMGDALCQVVAFNARVAACQFSPLRCTMRWRGATPSP